MDQLHSAHDCGHPANAPTQTGNITEHQAARINSAEDKPVPLGEQVPIGRKKAAGSHVRTGRRHEKDMRKKKRKEENEGKETVLDM
jgi:hypothetical protein